MSGWGTTADRSEIPSYLPEQIKDACIRTARGWELPAGGNDTLGATTELIVAMGNNTVSSVANDRPRYYFTVNNANGDRDTDFLGTFTGISGQSIEDIRLDIYDLEQTVFNGLTVTSSSLPEGLGIATAGDYTFIISGDLEEADTVSSFITVSDGITSVAYGMSWSIVDPDA